MNTIVLRRIVFIAVLIASTLLVGTIGFRVIEGYSLFEAFYMTLITITTVGYQEIRPLSQVGRVFNSFLIFFGVTAMFFAVGAMTQTIIELQLQDRLGSRRTRKAIRRMKDHYIVCGIGRVGRNAAAELQRSGVPFVMMDRNEQRVSRAVESGMTAVLADATRDESLREAGIDRARGFIAALASDADNVFVILSAKTLNPRLHVVARASEEDSEQKLRRAGADIVFSPYSMAGRRLAQALLRPHVVEMFDSASKGAGLDVNIEQVQIAHGSALARRKIGDLLWDSAGVIPLALRRRDGELVFKPAVDVSIAEGDILIVMGQQGNLKNVETALAGSSK